ncbi:SRPBCC domain-containing protein [Candidatus Marsarchaeota archaeon]|nr:SRPBCC domain-containing protein [Candidatus Marsarchaeota archaeon]
MEKTNSKSIEISLGGETVVKAQIKEVLDFINDLNKVATCIPDIKNFKKIDSRNFSFNIKGTLLKYNEDCLSVLVRGNNSNSDIKIDLDLNFKEHGSNTKMSWNARYKLCGFVNIIGRNLAKSISYAK